VERAPASTATGTPLLALSPAGLYCAAGDFHVDPWRPVARALITHAHADHARPGHAAYLAARPSLEVLRARLGGVELSTLAYGERLRVGDATVSFHPAGHVLGSAQVRVERDGEVWVVSGDYRVEADATCAPFEPVRCHTFVTESTFGLPIYRWAPQADVVARIRRWWECNAADGRASVLYCYSLGKAQRVIGALGEGPGPIVCHGAVETINRAYRAGGVALPPTLSADALDGPAASRSALVIAPPSAARSPWLRRFGDADEAFASGWMQLRGVRRRRGLANGFALSDHADWPGLQRAIDASGAPRVLVTHGYVAPMVRWLRERGLDAAALDTEFGGEDGDDAARERASTDAPSEAANGGRGGPR